MDKEHTLTLMGENMKDIGRMQNYMAKESTLDFMEKSMKGNGSMGFIMVKGYIYTFSDGIKWIGEWREDKPWNITEYSKDGKVNGKMVNGVQ